MSQRSGFILLMGAIALLSVPCLVWAQTPQINPEVYSQLKYRYIGSVGNRATAVAGVPGNPYIYYVGAASGGIFKTTDGGIHWEPIFDAEPVSSIGSLAVAASDANIVWAGTGESFVRSHISVGTGIYKSVDAGKTWAPMGLEKTGRIASVVIDSHNPNIVLACSLGHAYGPQPERGVFRSTDGGKNWERVLFVDENTGCSDLAIDPNNSHILFAGMWQLEIHTWGRTSGGPGSGLFKSTDEGASWKRLEGHGLPKPPVGRIAVRVARRDSNRIYALIETGDGVPMNGEPTQSGQLWRSDDGGENWQLVNSDRQVRGRTHYYTREEIAPDNENEVYFFSAAFSKTLDGGHTLTNMPSSPGGDNHEMWIDPTNGDRMAVVNDGGTSISVNRGRTWDRIQLPIAQIYHVTVDDQIPYFVYGNRQDGPSFRGPSNSLQFGSFGGGGGAGDGPGPIPRSLWHPVAGSESGFATPDPVDNNIIWSSGTGAGSVGGAVARFDERNHQAREVEVWPENVSGVSAADVKYRFNWEFPVTISPHDHNKVYVGSQYVHVTTDGGNSWQIISPDLTRNDKSRQQVSGGLTPDNIGVEYTGVVFAIAESPKDPGLIWAGTNDGLMQITRDGGKNWTNITKNIPNLPDWGTVSNIEASRYDAGAAYITVDFHQVNNRDPFVYKTTDYGKTWMAITNGIPRTMLSYAHCIREDPVRKGLLYLGTENALYVSFDDGRNWQALQSKLPHAPVYWIAVQERFHDLVVATYGRGFWILDDVTPLEQLMPEVLSSSAHLFAPRDAFRFRPVSQPAAVSYDPTAGQNVAYGAAINFYLKSKLGEKDQARITISDSSGKIVRELKCGPPKPEGGPSPAGPGEEGGGAGGAGTPLCEAMPGINRVWWDLRSEPSTEVRLTTHPLYAPDVPLGPEGWRTAPGVRRISLLAPSGAYTVKLAVGGQEFTQKLNVLKDPHSTGTESDIEAQTKFLSSLCDEMNTLAASVNQIESLRVQLASLEKELGTDDTAKAIRKAADDLADKLIGVEGNLLQLKLTGRGQDEVRWPPMLLQKISYLAAEVGSSSDFPPTTQQMAVQELLKQQGDKYQQEFEQLMAKDVAAFNAMLREKNIPNIIIKAH
jgi:photosystem II stability/assembly factor-like uncharacterized protein